MKSQKINSFKYLSLFFAMIVLVLITGCSGTTPTTPIINSFLANPTSITAGESSNLSWSVTDATTVVIDQSIGSVASTGTTAVSPVTSTTYTLTATNTAGSVTASVTVTVGAAYGSIDINSSPPGAKVYLDGADTGQVTPIVLTNKSAGTHTVKLELYHYESKEDTTISVTAGETTYLNWPLTYATTQNLTLQPGAEGKDAQVVEGDPDTNYGNNTYLYVGYYTLTKLRYRTYLYFDVNSFLPADAVVTTAYLKLHQYGFMGTGSLSIGLYQVTEDWTESAITWNNQPASSSDAEYAREVSSSTDTWKNWYIKDLLKGWMDGSITNYGMLLKPVNEPATNMALFDSSDYWDVTRHPQLVIEYYIP